MSTHTPPESQKEEKQLVTLIPKGLVSKIEETIQLLQTFEATHARLQELGINIICKIEKDSFFAEV